MLSPNTIANTSRGTAGKRPPVGPARPTQAAPCPSWNTRTTAPNAAATERRLRATAFRGTSTERKLTSSATSVPATTSPTTAHERPATASS